MTYLILKHSIINQGDFFFHWCNAAMTTFLKYASLASPQSAKPPCSEDTQMTNSTKALSQQSELISGSSTRLYKEVSQYQRKLCKASALGHCRAGAVPFCRGELLPRRRCYNPGLWWLKSSVFPNDWRILAQWSQEKHQAWMPHLLIR